MSTVTLHIQPQHQRSNGPTGACSLYADGTQGQVPRQLLINIHESPGPELREDKALTLCHL